MPGRPYARSRGDRVTYTREQSQRYFSKFRRWYAGKYLSPSRVEQVSPRTQKLYFPTFRSGSRHWIVTAVERQPDEPLPGGAEICPAHFGFCLPAPLQYIQVTLTTVQNLQEGVASATDPSGIDWVDVSANSTSTVNLLAPTFSLPDPPEPYSFMQPMYADPGCESACEFGEFNVTTNTEELPYVTNTINSFRLCLGGQTYEIARGISTNSPGNGLGTIRGTSIDTVSLIFAYADFTDTYACGGGATPDEDDDDGDCYTYSCNCPDERKLSPSYPSPYPSTWGSRNWQASDAGNRGACKHIYAASNYLGCPLPQPAGRRHNSNVDTDQDGIPDDEERLLPYDQVDPSVVDPEGDESDEWYRDWRRQQFLENAQHRQEIASDVHNFFRRPLPRQHLTQQEYQELMAVHEEDISIGDRYPEDGWFDLTAPRRQFRPGQNPRYAPPRRLPGRTLGGAAGGWNFRNRNRNPQ